MRIAPIFAALAASAFLVSCGEDKVCSTEAEAQAKLTELTNKIQEVAATNPEKLATLGPKAQEIAAKAQGADANDYDAACKAINEMLAELN